MRIVRALYEILSSKAFLLWLIGGWLLFYVSSAIWMKEAFAFFVSGLADDPIIQVPYLLFLVSGWLNFIRVFSGKFRSNKISFAAWLMLAAGALLYLTGFFLSINTRHAGTMIVGSGDTVAPPWGSGSYQISSISLGLKESLGMSEDGGYLEYEPKITLTDGSLNKYEVGAYPPARIGSAYFNVMDLGLAPGIKFYENGALVTEVYMVLRLLPPGVPASFYLEPYPFKFLVTLSPNSYEGDHAVPVFSLKSPVYSTRVFNGEILIAEAGAGEALNFDNYSLAYTEPDQWMLLQSSKDPGMPLVKYGIFIFVFGLPVYLLRLILSLFSKLV
jgi:hypothetical protein